MTRALPATFNNGARPLVMAYIGSDDPHRGDSKAAQGLGRIIANIMKGDYIYLDNAMLRRSFPLVADSPGLLTAHAKIYGIPDIAVGTFTARFMETPFRRKVFTVSALNEGMGLIYIPRGKRVPGFVPHHLTRQLLAAEKAEFKKHYPQIEGPLIAVMLGGKKLARARDLAAHLATLASAYPKATFFFCPCRRTEDMKDRAIRQLKGELRDIDTLAQKGVPAFNQRLKDIFANLAAQPRRSSLSSNVTILDVDYEQAIAGYNPYLGLLASADQIIVAGESFSLVSEALFTGKKVYTFEPINDYAAIENVISLELTDCTKPLPVVRRPKPFDLTSEIAKGIVQTYWKKRLTPVQPLTLISLQQALTKKQAAILQGNTAPGVTP